MLGEMIRLFVWPFESFELTSWYIPRSLLKMNNFLKRHFLLFNPHLPYLFKLEKKKKKKKSPPSITFVECLRLCIAYFIHFKSVCHIFFYLWWFYFFCEFFKEEKEGEEKKNAYGCALYIVLYQKKRKIVWWKKWE